MMPLRSKALRMLFSPLGVRDSGPRWTGQPAPVQRQLLQVPVPSESPAPGKQIADWPRAAVAGIPGPAEAVPSRACALLAICVLALRQPWPHWLSCHSPLQSQSRPSGPTVPLSTDSEANGPGEGSDCKPGYAQHRPTTEGCQTQPPSSACLPKATGPPGRSVFLSCLSHRA